MIAPERGDECRVPVAVSSIEAAVMARFGDPKLWSSETLPRMNVVTMAGIERSIHDDRTDYVESSPEERWVMLLYGQRVSAVDETGCVQFETASLPTMTAIHEHLVATVLAGERARPSALVDPPVANPLALGTERANNIFWLETIENGNWPIMSNGRTLANGEKEYFNHDYDATHLALFLLLPRETQDLITGVCRHELNYLAKNASGDGASRLSLPGDEQVREQGAAYEKVSIDRDGMYIIDDTTEVFYYAHLLHYLMHGNGATPEERLGLIDDSARIDIQSLDSSTFAATLGLRSLLQKTATMTNFNSRHGRLCNATQQEIAAEQQKFKQGVVRVAKKILGEYDWATDEVPAPPGTAESAPLRRKVVNALAGLISRRSNRKKV